MRFTRRGFGNLLLMMAALSFGACGDSTGPGSGGDGGGGGGGGGNGGGGGGGEEPPEFPEIPPAAQIFTDDIDSENGGVGVPNYTAWSNWTVVEGCVDLHGPGAKNPLPGNGVYMDLDGTCAELGPESAGTMESKQSFDLAVGGYTLEFLIAGNNQIEQSDTVVVSVGGSMSEEIVLDWQVPLQLLSFDFTVATATNGKIRLEHKGGDEQGILIDAVRLRRN